MSSLSPMSSTKRSASVGRRRGRVLHLVEVLGEVVVVVGQRHRLARAQGDREARPVRREHEDRLGLGHVLSPAAQLAVPLVVPDLTRPAHADEDGGHAGGGGLCGHWASSFSLGAGWCVCRLACGRVWSANARGDQRCNLLAGSRAPKTESEQIRILRTEVRSFADVWRWSITTCGSVLRGASLR